MGRYNLTGAQKHSKVLGSKENKTLEQLLKEATMSTENKFAFGVDNDILPAIIKTLSHRMYHLSEQSHNSAMELYDKVIDATTNWFDKTGYFEDGYRLSIGKPNHHGHVAITVRMSVASVTRTINLKSYITADRLFISTGENIAG